MPDGSSLPEIKISQLPVGTSANPTDRLEASQSDGSGGLVSRSITLDQVSTLVAGSTQIDNAIDGAIPTTLPPSGPAGGDLQGAYPNPTLKTTGTLANYLPLAGGTLTAGATLGWTGRSQITSPADGNFLLRNNAGTGFTMLQLGGTTNAFPGLFRSGNQISVLLADSSAFATLNANNFNTQNGLFFQTFGSITSPGVDGQFEFFNNAGTAATRLDIATDGTIKLRNRTNTADANLTAAAATLSGALVGYGTAVPFLTYAGASLTPTVQIAGSSPLPSFSLQRYTAATTGPVLNISKSSGTTPGTQGIVASADYMGAVSFDGSDGVNFVEGAYIRGQVDGAPATTSVPGALSFGTTAVGGTSPTERMRISSTGTVTFPTAAPVVLSGSAVGAGSATQAFIKASSTANLGIYYGGGAPAFSAAKGSLYSNTTATTTTTRLYVNTDGATTWANLTTSV